MLPRTPASDPVGIEPRPGHPGCCVGVCAISQVKEAGVGQGRSTTADRGCGLY